jgi:hypothetical protein
MEEYDGIAILFLARQFNLSGGHSKNSALARAVLVVEDETPVTMGHLFQATQREYQKMGQTMSESEFNGPAGAFKQEPTVLNKSLCHKCLSDGI